MSKAKGSLTNCNEHRQEHYLALLTHWEAWQEFHTGRQNQQKLPISLQNSEPQTDINRRGSFSGNSTIPSFSQPQQRLMLSKRSWTLHWMLKKAFSFSVKRGISQSNQRKKQQPCDPSANSKLSDPALDHSYQQQSHGNGTLLNVRGLHSYSRQHWTSRRFHRPLERELSTVNTSKVEQNQWLHHYSLYLFFPRRY